MGAATLNVETVGNRRSYVTPLELARMTGVSRWSIYRRLYSGEIQARRFGKLYLIPIREAQRLFPELAES